MNNLSIDGVRQAQTIAPTMPQPVPRKRMYFKPPPAKKEHSLWQRMQLPVLVMAGMAGGFFADNVMLGLGLLAGYAVVATIQRIPSRTTFLLALLLLAAISVLLLVKPNAVLVQNFATYAFVLLAIGVVTLARESRLPKRVKRHRYR